MLIGLAFQVVNTFVQFDGFVNLHGNAIIYGYYTLAYI